MANHILCVECMDKRAEAGLSTEEKSCSHGCFPGAVCAGCAKVRKLRDPYWSCLGTIKGNAQDA